MKTAEHKAKHAAYMREYSRRKKGYTAETVPNRGRRKNDAAELWKKVDVRGEDECWPWKGWTGDGGYGRTEINDVAYYAHRVIFDLVNPGVIELKAPKVGSKDGGFLLHRCDNPICCNPKHLFVGTHDDNMKDKVAKGRAVKYPGASGPRCKLTMDQARQARELRKQGRTVRELMKMFGISEASMKALLANRSYRE